MISISRSQLKRLINNNSLQKNVVYDFWIASHFLFLLWYINLLLLICQRETTRNESEPWILWSIYFNFSSYSHFNMKTFYNTTLKMQTYHNVCQMLSYQACPKNVWCSPFCSTPDTTFFISYIFVENDCGDQCWR